MLKGRLIAIKPMEWEDIEVLQKWYLDQEVMYWASAANPDNIYSKYDLEEGYQKESKSFTSRRFIIETREGEKIGTISYRSMNAQVRSTNIGMLIGEKDYWEKGYGTDILQTFLRYLFDQWNMNRVELSTWDDNQRAIKLYQKCGFQIEGRLREAFFVHGKYRDKIVMGILRKDYETIQITW